MANQVEVYEESGSWRWKFVARDGVLVASPVSYVSREAAEEAGERESQPKVVERTASVEIKVSAEA
jgi:uncharacterized protein YegP (UPF0339 family)